MASNESKGECSKNSPTTNPYSEIISSTESRDQHLLNDLETSENLDDTNLPEQLISIPDIEPAEHLQDMEATKLIANVVRNKLTSGLDVDFRIEENPLDGETDQMIESLYNRSDKIFKKLKNVQVDYNKIIKSKTSIISNILNEHFKVVHIKKANGFEEDTEVLCSDNDPLGTHALEKLNIDPVDEFVKTSDKLKQRVQNDEEMKGDGKKSSKNPEH